MKPDIFLKTIVDPTLAMLAGMPAVAIPVSDRARVMVLAIAGQESRWEDRRQIGCYTPGKYQTVGARGYWQFEGQYGSVGGLFQSTRGELSAVCAALDIPFDIPDVYEAIAWNDTLACAMARLLLWVDPQVLPSWGDEDTAYGYYLRGWRPGAPSRERWSTVYPQALALVKGTP